MSALSQAVDDELEKFALLEPSSPEYNVSRSYLQNEPQVRKIREVISSRVAGKVVDRSHRYLRFVEPRFGTIEPRNEI